MTTIPDLWPPSFGEPKEPTPAAILRQQGIALGKKTEGVVYGEVVSRTKAGKFAHVLEVVAPYLGFRHPIVVTYHDQTKVYPTEIGRPSSAPSINPLGMPTITEETRVSTATEFLDALKAILQREETTNLIQTLIAQSTEPTPS